MRNERVESMKIVPAVVEDIPQILEIEREAIAPPWSHKALLSEIIRDDSFFTVAWGEVEYNYKLLGFIILRRMGDDVELLQIAVDRAARRCGIADLLMRAALQFAGENALNPVFLEVRKSNDAAIMLYKKHGFKSVSIRNNYYNSPVEDAVVMARMQY